MTYDLKNRMNTLLVIYQDLIIGMDYTTVFDFCCQ